MATGKRFKVTKQPPSPAQQFDIVKKEVRLARQVVADRHVTEREEVPSNRHGRFKFEGVSVVRGTTASIQVTLENEDESLGRYGDTVGDLWGWLNKGTGRYGPNKEHYAIRPRFKQALAFVVGGVTIIRKYVFSDKDKTHPGMKPRRYTPKINKKLQPFERKQTALGFRNGWKRIKQLSKRK